MDHIDLGDWVERLDHVAFAARSVLDVIPMLEMLGGVYRNGGESAEGRFRWVQYTLPGSGKIEIIEPTAEDSFVSTFLDDRGPGLHHLTFKVRDLRTAVERARELGYEVVGYADDSPTWKEAFVHPRSAGGTVIQLAQFDDDAAAPPRTLEQVLAGEALHEE